MEKSSLFPFKLSEQRRNGKNEIDSFWLAKKIQLFAQNLSAQIYAEQDEAPRHE